MLWNAAWSWRELQDHDTFQALLDEYGAYFEEHHSPGEPENALFSLLKLTHASAGRIGIMVQEAIIDEGLQGAMTRELLDRLERVVGPSQLPGYGPNAGGIPWIQATHLLSGSSPNLRGKSKSAYMLKRFPADQIQSIHEHLTDTGRYSNPDTLLQVDSYGGEVNAVGPSDTAISHRSSIMKLQYRTHCTDPEEDQHHLDWIRRFYRDVYRNYENQEPTPDGVVDGCYVSYPDVDLVNWQTKFYNLPGEEPREPLRAHVRALVLHRVGVVVADDVVRPRLVHAGRLRRLGERRFRRPRTCYDGPCPQVRQSR